MVYCINGLIKSNDNFNLCFLNQKYMILPFLAARMPPVRAPLMMEFHGSSFCRRYTREQSIVENIPPQTAKLPATMGDRSLIAAKLPSWNKGFILSSWVLIDNISRLDLHCRKFIKKILSVTYHFSVESCWSISESFYGMEYTTSNSSHDERTARIIKDTPRAWFSRIFIHVSVW